MTGAEEHALVLESAWSRNACGTPQPANLSEPMPWAGYTAWLSLRTPRLDACTTSAIVGMLLKGHCSKNEHEGASLLADLLLYRTVSGQTRTQLRLLRQCGGGSCG